MIRRRDFITLVGGAAAAWPLAARAQQPGKLPTIGYLGAATPLAWTQWTAAFVQRLRELGWIEGRTVAIEYRWGEGRNDRFAEIAAEFVRLKVDVIVTAGTAAALATKQATSAIPIVFATAGSPVQTGLIASLARPSGNVTGLSNEAADIAVKRLQLLREAVPGHGRLATWLIPAARSVCFRWGKLRRRPASSALKLSRSKSNEHRTSRLLSPRSMVRHRRFTS